ncbi:3-isopropylmalate/(R)-2-methylmalate dehydratase small subunit [Roseovarius tolerans]|uniref:3-isopropylmalate dehydratase small subunit n=1 Tax=Roseovarius tolerans TaxID=74031 RepID=A0A1H8EQU1_9RHOB|nr:3-isopropylmalate dehydratase small subunit [Roseovarius tolerans]SEN21746.1 3-isopropylmalate/(R)-2-methylmalate dehydratase small subunit [Roseovarius tolerans]
MKKFERHTGLAAPLMMPNIDTDMIMPKQFLKRIDREGLAEGVFYDVRRKDDGTLRDDFVLNRSRYEGASILIAGRNFGCGSSREHAVWGLMQAGIRAAIAPSFAGIFFGNCEKNGLLAIVMQEQQVETLANSVTAAARPELTIDLTTCEIQDPEGDIIPFEIEPARRETLLDGKDHIEATLSNAPTIRAFEDAHFEMFQYLGRGR